MKSRVLVSNELHTVNAVTFPSVGLTRMSQESGTEVTALGHEH